MNMNTDRDRDDYERWQRYGRERGWVERMGDKVRSWFGDEEAERRRRFDEMQEQRSSGEYREGRATGNWGGTQQGQYEPHNPYSQHFNPYSQQQQQSGYYRPGNYGSVEYGRPTSWGGQHPEHFGGDHELRGERSEWPSRTYNRDRENWQQGMNREGMSREGMHREEMRGSYPHPYGSKSYGGYSGETFSGRGPKNFKKSDERLREDICERLCMHHEIDATDIDVVVQNGEATLTGIVHSRWEKRLAEEISEDIYGVNNVHNNLRVGTLQNDIAQRPADDKILNRPR
jgi:hypothetical protein